MSGLGWLVSNKWCEISGFCDKCCVMSGAKDMVWDDWWKMTWCEMSAVWCDVKWMVWDDWWKMNGERWMVKGNVVWEECCVMNGLKWMVWNDWWEMSCVRCVLWDECCGMSAVRWVLCDEDGRWEIVRWVEYDEWCESAQQPLEEALVHLPATASGTAAAIRAAAPSGASVYCACHTRWVAEERSCVRWMLWDEFVWDECCEITCACHATTSRGTAATFCSSSFRSLSVLQQPAAATAVTIRAAAPSGAAVYRTCHATASRGHGSDNLLLSVAHSLMSMTKSWSG